MLICSSYDDFNQPNTCTSIVSVCEYRQYSHKMFIFVQKKSEFFWFVYTNKKLLTLIYVIAHAIHSLSLLSIIVVTLIYSLCSLNLSSMWSILVDSSRRHTHTHMHICAHAHAHASDINSSAIFVRVAVVLVVLSFPSFIVTIILSPSLSLVFHLS